MATDLSLGWAGAGLPKELGAAPWLPTAPRPPSAHRLRWLGVALGSGARTVQLRGCSTSSCHPAPAAPVPRGSVRASHPQHKSTCSFKWWFHFLSPVLVAQAHQGPPATCCQRVLGGSVQFPKPSWCLYGVSALRAVSVLSVPSGCPQCPSRPQGCSGRSCTAWRGWRAWWRSGSATRSPAPMTSSAPAARSPARPGVTPPCSSPLPHLGDGSQAVSVHDSIPGIA